MHAGRFEDTRTSSSMVLDFTTTIVVIVAVAVSLTIRIHSEDSPTTRMVSDLHIKQIGLYGDSLASQASPYFSQQINRVLGKFPIVSTLDGTAPCDALPSLLAAAKSRTMAVVVIEFSGNSLTPCMSAAPAGSPTYFLRYRDDISLAATALVHSGADVVLAGAPETFRQYLKPCGCQKPHPCL